MSVRFDPHTRLQNPFGTPWQVAAEIWEYRQRTKHKNCISSNIADLLEILSEQESDSAINEVLYGGGR